MKTTFVHSSYLGSYICKCEILKVFKKTAKVKFTDPVSGEVLTRSMQKTDLAKWRRK
jgi:hypothetical protein